MTAKANKKDHIRSFRSTPQIDMELQTLSKRCNCSCSGLIRLAIEQFINNQNNGNDEQH